MNSHPSGCNHCLHNDVRPDNGVFHRAVRCDRDRLEAHHRTDSQVDRRGQPRADRSTDHVPVPIDVCCCFGRSFCVLGGCIPFCADVGRTSLPQRHWVSCSRPLPSAGQPVYSMALLSSLVLLWRCHHNDTWVSCLRPLPSVLLPVYSMPLLSSLATTTRWGSCSRAPLSCDHAICICSRHSFPYNAATTATPSELLACSP
jgi:hypothetical protein